MRSFQEILDDIGVGVRGDDPAPMLALADEMAELGSKEAIAWSGYARGYSYAFSGAFPEAMEQYRSTIAVFEELDDAPHVAMVTGLMATIYMSVAAYADALELYGRALTVSIERCAEGVIASLTHNMGIVYGQMGMKKEALEYYNRALGFFTEQGHEQGIATVSHNLGTFKAEAKEYQEAVELFRKSFSTMNQIGNHNHAALSAVNLADALIELGVLDEAEQILNEIPGTAYDDPQVMITYHFRRSHLAASRGDIEEAYREQLRGLELSEQASLPRYVADSHEALRELALQRKDFEGYVNHNTEFLRIEEEIRGQEVMQRVAVMEGERRVQAIEREREKERALLHGALPESVATRMLHGESVSGDHYASASVIFLDIVGFTQMCDRIPPGHVVFLLEAIFSALDDVVARHGVTKIKTIGDSYMAVAGVPEPLADHVDRAATCAHDMLNTLAKLQITMPQELGDTSWTEGIGDIEVRIGLHCGPVVAGVIGKDRLQYDVWGDTVNTASRMETTGEAGKIQVSRAFAEQLLLLRSVADNAATVNSNSQQQPKLTERGEVDIKGKGSMTTFWLEGV